MGERNRPESPMVLTYSSKDTLDIMVHRICEETQLTEATVRDLLSHGYGYHENKWMKTRPVRIENFF